MGTLPLANHHYQMERVADKEAAKMTPSLRRVTACGGPFSVSWASASNVGAAAGKYAVMGLGAAMVTAASRDAPYDGSGARLAIGLVLPG